MLNIDAEFNELLLVFRPNSRGLGAIGEFGEFGMALGEISAVEQEIHAQWRDVVRAGLGELADIKQDIEAAKKIISSTLDIGGKIEALKSRMLRLQNKLAKVKNPAAKAKIQEKINAATPQLNIAQGAYKAMQTAINIATDVLAKAGIVVEEAKKAVIETALKKKEEALKFVGKTKETAVAVGRKVKEAAAAAVQKTKEAAAALKRAAIEKAAALKRAAIEKAAALKRAAEQKIAQAKATAAAAAARVRQEVAAAKARAEQLYRQTQAVAQQRVTQARAYVAPVVQQARAYVAPVVQQARAYVAPVIQKAGQAVSWFKSRFGFKGLGELGMDPLTALIAVGSAVGIIQAALALANMFTEQGETVAEGEVPETIPIAKMDKYKDAAAECYNSAVAQGYVVDTPAKEALLNKKCRERAAAQFAVPTDIPYTDKDLIDEFDAPPSGMPMADNLIQLPEGGGCFSLSTGLPEPCRDVVPYVPPGGYTPEYDIPERPLPDGRRILRPRTGEKILYPPSEPGIYDEFETLVPGIKPVPGYPPGIPTTVPVPGMPAYRPTYPEYEPGVEMPSEEECPDYPDMTDDEYCSNFPECCEDVPEGCPEIPEMTDAEYCAAYPQCCEETDEADTSKSVWEL